MLLLEKNGVSYNESPSSTEEEIETTKGRTVVQDHSSASITVERSWSKVTMEEKLRKRSIEGKEWGKDRQKDENKSDRKQVGKSHENQSNQGRPPPSCICGLRYNVSSRRTMQSLLFSKYIVPSYEECHLSQWHARKLFKFLVFNFRVRQKLAYYYLLYSLSPEPLLDTHIQ